MSVPWVVLEAVELVEALHPLLIRILGKVSFSLTLLMLVVLVLVSQLINKRKGDFKSPFLFPS